MLGHCLTKFSSQPLHMNFFLELALILFVNRKCNFEPSIPLLKITFIQPICFFSILLLRLLSTLSALMLSGAMIIGWAPYVGDFYLHSFCILSFLSLVFL